ncbi:MAG TPA: UvrD-helicase domain-containing protein [Candidatus Saccharimonadales bacterium]|nr:UvrD-helicase domain-containing protein [Candidatus Saccharimonadales bacterium]
MSETKTTDIFTDLNEPQQEAVRATEGPVLILAGAGSGKTKCLTHRMAYIVAEHKAELDEILMVTFTNKAAQELGHRILKILGHDESAWAKNPNLVMRRRLPWVGTFHSICVRLLRAEAENIGLSRSFTIFDSDDSLLVIKQALKDKNLDPKQYSPQAIRSIISNAKNELQTAAQYETYADGHFQTIAVDVFKNYEKELKKLSALDFDDLIGETVRMLENNPAIKAKYNKLFKYVMVDEYQDTNHAQYRLTLALMNPTAKNLCVVGDDYQCLLPNTKVLTLEKELPIEKVKKGTKIVAASGFGETQQFSVNEVRTTKYKGSVVQIRTKSGRSVTMTPEHICFARLQPKEGQWYVYLMFRADKGYRLGITRGIRNPGKGEINGLLARANQERADKMWIIVVTSSLVEARYQEELLSLKYQIPKVLFFSLGRDGLTFTQKHIDQIYKEIDTTTNAENLMADYLLFSEYPHFRPQAVTTELSNLYPGRAQAYLIQFGDSRVETKLPWHAHRVRLTTSNTALLERLSNAGIETRADKKSRRVETSRKHFADAYTLAEELSKAGEVDLHRAARLTKEDRNFPWQPAAHLRPGMLVPIVEDGKVVTAEIAEVVFEQYEGLVYDIDVVESNTLIANGIVVHNSIYGWRGANFKNILNFARDFPGTTVIKLEQNYRSTKTILKGANQIVDRIKRKSDKKLWTDNEEGPPITVFEAHNAYGEADFIAEEARVLHNMGKNWGEFAVLYRTNAQSRVIEEIFLNEGVPYRLIGALRFYERKEVKDILAYLRFLLNQSDTHSLARIINVPTRGIGPKTLATGGEKVQAFLNEMATLRAMVAESTPQVVIETLLKTIKYQDYVNDGTPEGEARWENVEELKNLAFEFENLEDFLEHVALVSDVDNYDGSADAVTMMSMHAAKGLEFTTVFLTGMEEGLFPHLRALEDQSEMDEERRLCYVGMTRARKRLYLTHARQRIIHGGLTSTLPSRFLAELDESLLDRI